MKDKIKTFRENHPGVLEVIVGVTGALVALKFYTTQVEKGMEVFQIREVWGDQTRTFKDLVAYQRNGEVKHFRDHYYNV